MEKVYSLNSTQPSSIIAKQTPRSLQYYLSAGLHHRLVGRFATVAFFLSPSQNQSDYPDNNVKIRSNSSNRTSNRLAVPRYRKAQNKDSSPNRMIAGVSERLEHGPIANYSQTESDPALIKNMVKLSNEVLASARTVFPIDPFPDTVVLDRTTLNITKRTFFFSNDTLSIRIEDILNAQVNVGPFLGSLTIASRVLSSEDRFTISNLWRKDAIHLKHMIQGYVIALHNEIEISHLSKEELIYTISELGHDLNN